MNANERKLFSDLLADNLPCKTLIDRLAKIFTDLYGSFGARARAARIVGEMVAWFWLDGPCHAAGCVLDVLGMTPELHESFTQLFMYRNFQIARAVLPHIKRKANVLDVETGDGFVARMLAEQLASGVRLEVTDAIDRRHPFCKSLPWVDYTDAWNKTKVYHQLLFITVLHHWSDQEETFRTWLTTLKPKGLVLIVENTYLPCDRTGHLVNVFFDWFFHSVITPSNYPTPFAHRSIGSWRTFLKQNGCRVLHEQPLEKIAVVNVHHHLFLAEKKR